jgi:hypothetical protein
MTFKNRVTKFWDWYPRVAARLAAAIQQDHGDDLTSEIGDFMQQTLPNLSWVVGTGENEGHSFTLTGEGYKPKQLLAEYWHSRAVEIPNWTFYGSRQPTPSEQFKGMAIRVGEQEEVDVETFMLKTSVDNDTRVIHLVAWHPALKHVPEEHHIQILFLLLDEALGEFGTQTRLGEIKVEPITASEATRMLSELPEFVKQVADYHAWEYLSPLEAYTGYEVNSQSDSRRGDTVVGTTCIPDTVFEFLDNDGKLQEDPFEGIGAEFAYIAMDASIFPDGGQVDVRSNIENAVNDALESESSGRTLGGAFGTDHSYIDLLIFDGDNSRQIVRDTLDRLQLQNRSRIESFL